MEHLFQRHIPVFTVVSWSIGILAGMVKPGSFDLSVHVSLALIFWLLLCVLIFKKNVFTIIFVCTVCYTGWLRSSIELTMTYPEPFLHIQPEEPYTFTGRITKIREPDNNRTRLWLNNVEIHLKNRSDTVSSRSMIMVNVFEPYTSSNNIPQHGQKIKIKGFLKQKLFCNSDPSTISEIIRCRKFPRYTVSLGSWDQVKIISTTTNTFKQGVFLLRKKISSGFNIGDRNGENVAGMLNAIILGNRDLLSSKSEEQFRVCGIYHLLAISGLHVGIVSGFLLLIMRIGGLRVPVASITALIIVWIYGVLVELRPSVIRAIIMISLYLIARAGDLIPDTLNLLAIAALVILLMNPFEIVYPGFQLTFLATLGIIQFFHTLEQWLQFIPFRWLRFYISCSIAAQSMTLLAVAYHFNQVSLMGFFSTLIVFPFFCLFLGAGMFHAVIIIFLPWLASVTGFIAWLTGFIFLHLVSILAKADFLFFYVSSPCLFTIIIFYAGIIVIFKLPVLTVNKKILILLVLIFMSVTIPRVFHQHDDNLFNMTVLNTGAGESMFMKFPGGESVLLDGAGSHDDRYDVGNRFLVPWLRRHGTDYLDLVILSHPHPDHMMGLFAVINQLPIGEFWYGKKEPFVPAFDGLLHLLEHKEIGTLSLGSGLSSSDYDPGMNNNSLVLKIVYGNFSILLTGDIEKEAEETLAAYGSCLKATILKSPHHGSKTSSTLPFLEQVHSDYIVISAARNPYSKLPSPVVLDRYSALSWKPHVFNTGTHGNIHIKTDGETLCITTDTAQTVY